MNPGENPGTGAGAAERVAALARYRKCRALRDFQRRKLVYAEQALSEAADALAELGLLT